MASQAVKTRSGRQSKPSEKKGYMDEQQDPDNTGKKAKRKRGDKENAPEKKKGKVQHEPAQKEFNIVALPTNSTANKSQSIDLRARSAPIPKPKVTPARKVAGERHPVPTSSQPRRTLTPANRERLLQLKKPFGAASVGRHATAATMPSMSQPEARKMERPKRKQYSSSQPVQSVQPRHPRESGQRVRHQQITYGRPKLAQVTEDHEDRHTSDQRRGYVNTSQYDQGEGEEGGGGDEDDDEHQGEYGSHADEGGEYGHAKSDGEYGSQGGYDEDEHDNPNDWSGYPQQDADDEQEEDDYDPDMDDMVPRPSAAPSQDWRGMENHLTDGQREATGFDPDEFEDGPPMPSQPRVHRRPVQALASDNDSNEDDPFNEDRQHPHAQQYYGEVFDNGPSDRSAGEESSDESDAPLAKRRRGINGIAVSIPKAKRVAPPCTGKQRPRASDYDSTAQEVLALAIKVYKAYVSITNGYPDKMEELSWAKQSWDHASTALEIELAPTRELIKMITSYSWHLRGEMKVIARSLVEATYRFRVSAKSAVHLRNRKKVTLLRENDAFVYRKRGKTVDDHKGLYQAEIIQQMANRVYFKKRTDDGILLRAQYSPFPVPALALILTAVECAIDEWTDGSWTKVSFTEEAYRAAYEHHLEELNMFETTSGDLKVVSQICKRIYDDGRVYAKAGQDESASARQLDPRAVARAIHQFQLSDDEMSEGDPEED